MDPHSNSTESLFPLAAGRLEEAKAEVGALLVGTFLGLALYGISIHQAYDYFRLYSRKQMRTLKGVVSVILVLETVHSALCVNASYDLLVVVVPPTSITSDSGWSLNTLNVFASVIFCFTQCVFARRVSLLWPKYGLIISITAGIFTIVQFGVFRVIGAEKRHRIHHIAIHATDRHNGPANQGKSSAELQSWLGAAHSAGVMIASELLAGALIHRLRSSRTGFKRTDHIIHRLTIYTFNTGLLVGISSLLSFIFAVTRPGSFLASSVNIVAAKLYAVALLAELNSRQDSIANDVLSQSSLKPTPIVQYPRPSSPQKALLALRRGRRASRALRPSQPRVEIGITVTTEIEVHTGEHRPTGSLDKLEYGCRL
ncbi:hypothetical protein C8Q78DRAFT_1082179 [Trametes maxima]|nr:hypothetical protein C8Q78DRAFT_1082179 [Trametes maxima]